VRSRRYRALLPLRRQPGYWLRALGKDCLPRRWILRLEPAFNLLAVFVVEDADDAGGNFEAVLPHTHHAKCANMIVVTEHIMFFELESTRR
jgi:hypothetical protein